MEAAGTGTSGAMTDTRLIHILNYSLLVGQENLKHALELAYIAPRIGGVLISGERGTGKSTAVRAFAAMVNHGRLPVTLPINATEDRVVGGWKIDKLMRGEAEEQPGLLMEANNGLLYVDEVNLLDDHIVNILLDAASTGVLVIQRDGLHDQRPVSFTLVGTMNPEEGGLRPQLLDRFGLIVNVTTEQQEERRCEILNTVLRYDAALPRLQIGEKVDFVEAAREADRKRKRHLDASRDRLHTVEMPSEITDCCVRLARNLRAEGHRGDYVLAMAAQASAALENADKVTRDHVQRVARLVLEHRHPAVLQGYAHTWDKEEEDLVHETLHQTVA